jgi:small-conductance mechanosensitive channel
MQVKIISSIIAVIICIITWFLTNRLHKYLQQNSRSLGGLYIVKTIQILITVISIGYIFNQFDVTKEIWSSVITNISLIVVVLGFAAQESIKNILSGYMVAGSKVFNIGQRITLVNENITGTVVDITSRHVTIRKPNNILVIVPNSVINNAIIENSSYTDDGVIANYLDINVSYESNVDRAIEIIREEIDNNPLCLKDKEFSVLCRELSPESYNIRAMVWTANISDNFQACSDIRLSIKKRFNEENIEIPYNHIQLVKK